MKNDVFGEFESFSEILGYVFHAQGPEALLELLKIAALDADTLRQAAKEMSAAGMDEAAELVAGAAARAADPKASEIAAILEDPIPGNRRAYLASMIRKGAISMDDLIPQGSLDPAALDYVARAKVRK